MKSFYCPRVSYCFTKDDMNTLNERIKAIALNYHEEHTGWFDVDETQHLIFVDDQDNMYTIYLRGRFWRADEPNFDLEFVRLEKDGISFHFDTEMFDDHV
jgi:hypothetical protein